ncbi:MAG: hypothetical protein Q7T11_06560, partial [Deltaproteobacteria bacterium]|nr:hypothetical protein [Deltaproteobacteria bacterium]
MAHVSKVNEVPVPQLAVTDGVQVLQRSSAGSVPAKYPAPQVLLELTTKLALFGSVPGPAQLL